MRSQTILCPFLALLLLLISPSNSTLVVTNSTNNVNGNYTIAQEWFDGSQKPSQAILGPIVPFATSNLSLLSNAIVLIEDKDFLIVTMTPSILAAQNAGAAAIILRSAPGDLIPGKFASQTMKGTTAAFTAPIFSILAKPFDALKASSSLGTITPDGNENQWKMAAENIGIIIWYVIVALVDGVTALFGVVRLIQYIKSKGCHKSIAITALGLNIFGLTVATFYWFFDPNGIRQLAPRQMNQILVTFALPFIFSADLLVVLYWLELLTHKKITAVTYLKRLRIPFYVFVGYLIVAEIGTSVLRVFISGTWPSLISIANIIIALAIIMISVFVVIRRIRKSQKEGFVVNDRLKRMNAHMIAMAALSIVAIIFLVIYMLLITGPISGHIALGLVSISVCSVTFNQINMFQRPSGTRGSSIQTRSSASKTRHQSEVTTNSRHENANEINNDRKSTAINTSSLSTGTSLEDAEEKKKAKDSTKK